MKLNGLIVSPVLPQLSGQGNRARVHDISKNLSDFSNLHLLYYLYETVGETENTFDKFEGIKDIFNLILPVVPTVPIQPNPKNTVSHQLDEWWDPILEGTLKYLSNNFKYDYVLVNYIWLSKALEFFPQSVVKVIDAHDKFTDRDLIYKKIGVRPEFFYTNIENETAGLNRANIVIGIQSLDSQFFKKYTNTEVVTIPHLNNNIVNSNSLNTKIINPNLIRLGIMGVANQVNINSYNKFIKLLEKKNIGENLKIIAAGSMCEHLISSRIVTKLGFLENIQNFFDQIDIFVNPVEFSTGQKIKLADSISYDCPFVSTANGTEGLPVTVNYHRFNDVDSLVNFFFSTKLDDVFILKMKRDVLDLKERISKIRDSSFNAIKNLIYQKRKRTVLFYSPKNSFFSDKLIYERLTILKNNIAGSSIIDVVVNDDVVLDNPLESGVYKLSNFLTESGIHVIDTLIIFGNSNKKLLEISRKIIYDGISLIQNDGTITIPEKYNYFYSKKLNTGLELIKISLDLRFNISNQKFNNPSKIYILASNYEDNFPRTLKTILQKKSNCEIIYPHQIKFYNSLDRYNGILEVCFAIIVLDSSDKRYDLLKEICNNFGVPSFAIDTYLNSLPSPILSTKLFFIINSLPNLFKSAFLNSVPNNSRLNIWQKFPYLWNFIRS